MSQTILDLASEYFPGQIRRYGSNVFGIDLEDGSLSSLRIFSDTDTYYHYVERRFGRQEQFLRYIVGLSGEEIKGIIGEVKQNELLALLRQVNNQNLSNSGFSIQDVVATPGYNSYIQDERHIDEEIAQQFGLEINDDGDIYIPLQDLNDFKRVGSLVRSSTCNHKYGKYRTYMIGSHHKPHCWPAWNLKDLHPDTIFLIVEGAWSLMRLQQVCLSKTSNVIPLATLTNHVDENLIQLLHEFPIILIPDSDDGGTAMSEKFKKTSERLGYTNFEIYRLTDEIGRPLYLDEADDEQLRGLMNNIAEVTSFTFIRSTKT